MRARIAMFALVIGLGPASAIADLEIHKDYSLSDAVWGVTTVHVKSNMIDAYLEGIKKTWLSQCEVQKSLQQVDDCSILISELPDSGDFNIVLMTKYRNGEMLAPDKARYDAFVAKVGAAQQKASTQQAQRDYPAMREITGEYRLRALTMK